MVSRMKSDFMAVTRSRLRFVFLTARYSVPRSSRIPCPEKYSNNKSSGCFSSRKPSMALRTTCSSSLRTVRTSSKPQMPGSFRIFARSSASFPGAVNCAKPGSLYFVLAMINAYFLPLISFSFPFRAFRVVLEILRADLRILCPCL